MSSMATCDKCDNPFGAIRFVLRPGWTTGLWICQQCCHDLSQLNIGKVVNTPAGKYLRIDNPESEGRTYTWRMIHEG